MNFHPGEVDVAAFASFHGFAISEQGRLCRPGVALAFNEKVAISIKYLKAQELGACRSMQAKHFGSLPILLC